MNTVAPGARELFEIATSRELSSRAPTAISYSAQALAYQAIRSGCHALTDLLARRLTAFVQKATCVAESALSSEKSTQGLPIIEIDGMFAFDALAADELESTGPYGADLANEVRSRARERWLRGSEAFVDRKRLHAELSHLWSPKQRNGLVPFALLLANALWHDIIESRLQEAKPAALSLEVIEKIENAFWARDRRIETHAVGSVIKIDREIVARLQTSDRTPELPAEVFDSLSATRSLAAHRLLRFLVALGYEQFFVSDTRDFRKVQILHGFAGLAARLGLHSSKAANELSKALLMMQHAHIRFPHGESGGLLTWTLYPEAHGRPAVLSIVLGDALLPNYVGIAEGNIHRETSANAGSVANTSSTDGGSCPRSRRASCVANSGHNRASRERIRVDEVRRSQDSTAAMATTCPAQRATE
jgi:hypothetical protein